MLVWLLGTGIGAVLGVLMFGRGYKKKIAAMAREIGELQRQAKEKPAPAAQPAINQVVVFSATASDPSRELRNAVQAKTVQGLKETINRLPQHPLGDGHAYTKLPDGTNIVTMADGTIRLALPVRLQVDMPGQITPKDTITDRGILTLYESGFPKSLTTWEDLEKGKQANHPAGPPPKDWGLYPKVTKPPRTSP